MGRGKLRAMEDRKVSERPLADAIWVALMRYEEDPTGQNKRKLYILADRMVNDAIDGNEQARKEILDRIDGKVSAQVQLGGEGGLTISVNTGIERPQDVVPGDNAKVINHTK